MKDKALNKIESKIRFILSEVRDIQDQVTGKRVKPFGLTNEQLLQVIAFKNREIEVLSYIKMKLEL